MTVQAELARDAATDTFEDVARLVEKIARSFARAYSQSEDEVGADAMALYLDAYLLYVEDRCDDFRKWVGYYVRKKLTARMTALRRKRLLFPAEEVDLESIPHPDRGGFDLGEFLAGLGEDAAAVVRLVVDAPRPLELALRNKGVRTPRGHKGVLSDYLRRRGWGLRRVWDSYREIRSKL